jgi:hypothetical protein
MTITVFDLAIIIGSLCGLIMVVGSIILLYKGVITLNSVSDKSALDVEFINNLRITTHFPALGLFIIGLCFIIIAIFSSRPDPDKSITIKGQIISQDPSSATIFIKTVKKDIEQMTPSFNGDFSGALSPNMINLMVEIVAPGYQRPVITKTFLLSEIKNKNVFDLGINSFEGTQMQKIISNSNIVIPITNG